jgi:hypothetical protein
MRTATYLLLLALLAACTTAPRYKKSEYAEIATIVAPGCELPSARFRELRDEKGRQVAFKELAVQLRPGVYDIGLSCGVTFDREQQACIGPEGNVALEDVPTYKLIIRPKVRYVFSCLKVNGVWTYHMVESDR